MKNRKIFSKRKRRKNFFQVFKRWDFMGKNDKFLINDLSILADRLPYIRPAMVLLNIYIQKVDAQNRADVPKTVLAKVLNVSAHTISNWLRKLSKAGAIKYKYSGSVRLNPNFYFYGTQDEFDEAEKEWKAFKSDMKVS